MIILNNFTFARHIASLQEIYNEKLLICRRKNITTRRRSRLEGTDISAMDNIIREKLRKSKKHQARFDCDAGEYK